MSFLPTFGARVDAAIRRHAVGLEFQVPQGLEPCDAAANGVPRHQIWGQGPAKSAQIDQFASRTIHFKWFSSCFLPRNAPSSPQKSWLPRLAAMRLVASSASLHCLRAASAPTAAPRWKPLSRSDRDSSNSSRKARRLPRSAFVALRARKESMAQRCEPHAVSLGAAAFPPRRLRRAHAYRNPAGKRTSQANRHNYIMLINVN